MHTIDETIQAILSAKKIEDIINGESFKSNYNALLKKIHPDICKHTQAHQAMIALQTLKKIFEEEQTFSDDVGPYAIKGNTITYTGDTIFLKKSYDNFITISSLPDPASKSFRKYLPQSMVLKDNELIVTLEKRSVPLSDQSFHQDHVNWILSRMLEFNAWLAKVGYVHCGLNPDSILVVPETHGIIVHSFYHMKQINSKLDTISGRYKSWYTPSIFDKKVAIPLIDNELAKKCSIYLLGDKSGNGIKFKKTHNKDFINFVISQDFDPMQSYIKYRELLDKNFPKKFCPLDV